MKEKLLHISSDLSLPLELAARTQCIFAQKGAGKTYAAGVQAEEMLAGGVQVCILDPTGVWWGLQSSASGGKGSHDIIVMGGGHADVPLEPEAGEIVANFLVETGQSVVLDVSQFESQAAQDRFALALATKLYRLKAHDKANIHIFLDEADQFCPMKPQHGQERLLHAWSLIVRLGRSRGLGLTAISNRPAAVHTDIRNNIDLLTCLRVTGPHDFNALRLWTGINATSEQANEFLKSVPTLANGVAFFWSPAWLQIFQRAKIREKHTFDSSRTPKPGERAIEPKERRTPNLTKLTEQIKASVEKAKLDDPKILRMELAKVQTELTKAQSAKPAPEIKTVEKPVLSDKQIEKLESFQIKADARVEAASKKIAEIVNPLMTLLHDEKREVGQLLLAAKSIVSLPAPTTSPPIQQWSPPTQKRNSPVPPGLVSSDGPPLGKIEMSLLGKLADRSPVPTTMSMLFSLAGFSVKSSNYPKKGEALADRGLAVKVDGGYVISAAGITLLGADYTRAPAGGAAALAHWLKKLPDYESKMLEAISRHTHGVDDVQLAAAIDRSLTSSAFPKAIKNLISLNFITAEAPYKLSSIFA